MASSSEPNSQSATFGITNKRTYSARVAKAFTQLTVVFVEREAVLARYFTGYFGTLDYKIQRTDNTQCHSPISADTFKS